MREYVGVTLRVDTSSDLYLQLLNPLRDERSLSSFIMNLLTAYHGCEGVKDAVYAFNEASEDAMLDAIEAQLQGVAFSHSKSVALLSETKSFVSDNVSMNVPEVKSLGGNTSDNSLEQIRLLTETVASLSETINRLISDPQKGGRAEGRFKVEEVEGKGADISTPKVILKEEEVPTEKPVLPETLVSPPEVMSSVEEDKVEFPTINRVEVIEPEKPKGGIVPAGGMSALNLLARATNALNK